MSWRKKYKDARQRRLDSIEWDAGWQRIINGWRKACDTALQEITALENREAEKRRAKCVAASRSRPYVRGIQEATAARVVAAQQQGPHSTMGGALVGMLKTFQFGGVF